MYSTAAIKPPIHAHINDASNLTDLLPVLQHIPLTEIKNFLNQQVSELSITTGRAVHCNSLPLDDIFPEDIIQYILSFAGDHTRKVNKNWNHYSAKNERNYYNKLVDSLNSKERACGEEIRYDNATNKTIIVHKSRTKLLPTEIDLGFIGPINDLYTAMGLCKDNDRILILNGVHDLNGLCKDNFTIHNNIQLIGVNTNVIIRTWSPLHIAVKLYIENVTLAAADGFTKALVRVKSDGHVWLQNCIVECQHGHQGGIIVDNQSDFNADNCMFSTIYGALPVKVSPLSRNINISNCMFTNNSERGLRGHQPGEFSCICIYVDQALNSEWRDGRFNGQEIEFVNLTCTQNTFVDKDCYPIAVFDPDNLIVESIRDSGTCVLRNNTLRGSPTEADTLHRVRRYH